MSLAAGPSHAANEPNGNLLNDKNFKRKFQDAMQNLDEAVGPMEPLSSNQPPSKKPRVGRSLYATLAKYGIKREAKPEAPSDKLDSLSKTAPHLAAIIARTTSRARKALPLRFGHPPPTAPSISSAPSTSLPGISSESEYRPSSTTSFLTRLATFKLTTYANKPPAIDAVSASKCGWVNNGKDRLVCGICHVSWVVGGNQGMSRDAANALVEKQRQSLVDMHKDGCPWKTRQCDPSIYRVPLYAPVAMARELKSRAEKMDQVLQGVEIRHPMTASQVQSLLSTVKAVKQPSFSFSFDEPPLSVDGDTVMRDEPTALEPSSELSESAVLTALFGWSIVPPSDKSPRLPSISRANSVLPSASRANSVAPQTPVRLVRTTTTQSVSRESSPGPSFRSRPSFFHRGETSPSASALLPSVSTLSSGKSKQDTTLLSCTLCQRRIGLWAFMSAPQSDDQPTPSPSAASLTPGRTAKVQPQRQLDILKEHRSYCPYVVRSTELPSMPLPVLPQATRSNSTVFQMRSSSTLLGQPGAVEGWRAVLTVVLRYGAAQRQRFGIPNERRTDNPLGIASEDTPPEVNEVEAMVADVKSHGGRELLKYVKNLLG